MDDGVTAVSELAQRVRSAAPRLGDVRLVCVDGPAGSGKTTLARRLARAVADGQGHADGRGSVAGPGAGSGPTSALEVVMGPAPAPPEGRPGDVGAPRRSTAGAPGEHRPAVVILHLDDLYEGWSGLDGVWPRLEEQVLGPVARGRSGRYQQYDWEAGRFAGWVDVPVPSVLVVEGCGSAPRAVDGRAVLVLWVEAPSDVRLARGLERDGGDLRDEWLRWMALEEEHFAVEATRARADVVVDGCAPLDP